MAAPKGIPRRSPGSVLAGSLHSCALFPYTRGKHRRRDRPPETTHERTDIAACCLPLPDYSSISLTFLGCLPWDPHFSFSSYAKQMCLCAVIRITGLCEVTTGIPSLGLRPERPDTRLSKGSSPH